MFQTIDIATRALDGLMNRYNAISNNIANVDTDGYKRQDYRFEQVLKDKMESGQDISIEDMKDSFHFDLSSHTYGLNGNNIDIDSEMTIQAQTKLKYDTIITRTNAQLKQYTTLLQSLK